MHYNPNHHHRRSIRLPDYDYSRPGAYFITLCIHDWSQHLFGEVIDGKMVSNEFGVIADKWISSIPGRFENIGIESSVVMPNHVHLVVVIRHSDGPVTPVVPVGAIHELTLRELPIRELPQRESSDAYRKQRRVMTIPKIVGYYRMNVPVWQRNYFEHIIRDEKSRFLINRYIWENPLKWHRDSDNHLDGELRDYYR
jgi:putative transposase